MIRTSRIPEGVVVEGQIRGQGDLVIAGLVEGTIDVDGLVVVEATGQVRGPIRARSLVVGGAVQGNLQADETVRLESGARVVGDVMAERVSAALGAMVRGRVRMAGAERLDRTEGGTIRAPWSSAGTLVAARTAAGMIAAPKQERAVSPERPPSTEIGDDRAKRTRTRPSAAQTPHTPAPVATTTRAHTPRVTAPAAIPVTTPTSAAPPVIAPITAPVAAPIATPPAAPRRAPPPPVMPSVGRVRAHRKDSA